MTTTKFKGTPVHIDGEFIRAGAQAPDFELVKGARQWGKLPETTHTTRQASRGRKGCYYNGTERKDP